MFSSFSLSPLFLARLLSQLLLLWIGVWYLWLCPYSKVEESFGLQAVHDLTHFGIVPALMATLYRTPLYQYDHVSYPGVVPRSFVLPHAVSFVMQAVQLWYSILFHKEFSPATLQFLSRLILWLGLWYGWCRLAAAVDYACWVEQQQKMQQQTADTSSTATTTTKTTTTTTATTTTSSSPPISRAGTLLLLIVASQFHGPYYGSRWLPNTAALGGTLFATSAWLRGQIPLAAQILIITTAILRCDVILFLFVCGLLWLYQRDLTFGQAIKLGITTGLRALLVCVPLDSLLWQQWGMWPEAHVLWFNTIQNQSRHWGIMPWHFYITNAVPKLLLGWILVVPAALVCQNSQKEIKVDPQWFPYAVVAVGYIGLYSALGHKEVRFLFPILPVLNVLVAVAADRLWGRNTTTTTNTNTNTTTASGMQQRPNEAPRLQEEEEEEPNNNLNHNRRLFVRRFVGPCVVLLAGMLSCAASGCNVAMSRHNYPGGMALQRLSELLLEGIPPVKITSSSSWELHRQYQLRVYLDIAAGMTGISLFGQRHVIWQTEQQQQQPSQQQQQQQQQRGQASRIIPLAWDFVKAGYEPQHLQVLHQQPPPQSSMMDHDAFCANTPESEESAEWTPTTEFTHLITEEAAMDGEEFVLLETIPGHPHLQWRQPPFQIQTRPALYLWERHDWNARRKQQQQQADT